MPTDVLTEDDAGSHHFIVIRKLWDLSWRLHST